MKALITEIYRAAIELKLDIENTLFLVSKNQPVDERKTINNVLKRINDTLHPDIVVKDDRLQNDLGILTSELSNGGAKSFPKRALKRWLILRK